MKSKVDAFLVTFTVISVILFNVLSQVKAIQDEVYIDTNFTVQGEPNGTLVIAWGQPVTRTSQGETHEYPTEKYILSYTYSDEWNKTRTGSATTAEKKVFIPNAYLGSYYQLELSCQIHDVFVKCKNQTVLAFPSCPKKWYQHLSRCYYISKTAMTWSDAKGQCQSLPNDLKGVYLPVSTPEEEINQIVKNDMKAKNQSLFWTAVEPCIKIQPESVSEHNCCLSLKPTVEGKSFSLFAVTSVYASCSSGQQLPSICGKDIPVITSVAQNVNFTSLPNNSVKVSWSDVPVGWNLLWRTITIYNDTNSSLIYTTVTSNARKNAIIPSLSPGQTYKVLIWPHKDGALLEYTAKFKFHLVSPRNADETNAGCVEVPVQMEAFLLWNGTINVFWTAAKSKKDSKAESVADGYRLIYGLNTSQPSEYRQVNLTATNYRITSFKTNSTYTFYLVCVFGSIGVNCGKIAKFDVGKPLMAKPNSGNYSVLETFTNMSKSWSDAERHCQNKDGHLLTVSQLQNNTKHNPSYMGGRPYWIGGSNCNGSNIPEWVDDSTWPSNVLKNVQPNATHCCIQAIYLPPAGQWSYANCDSKLQFICEFGIKDLGILKNLTATNLSSTTFQLKWQTTNLLWHIPSYEVYICDLTRPTHWCTLYTSVTSSPVVIKGLLRKTSYRFEVKAKVVTFNTSVIETVTIRTGNTVDVFANVSTSGKVMLQWSNENYVLGKPVVYVIKSVNNPNFSTQTFKTNSAVLYGLPLGGNYSFTMFIIDNATGTVLDTTTFSFTASPSCKEDEFRFQSFCYWAVNDELPHDNGTEICKFRQGDIAAAISDGEIKFLHGIANDLEKTFWIAGKTSAVRKNEGVINLNKTDKNPGENRKRRESSFPTCNVVMPSAHSSGNNFNGIHEEKCGQLYPIMCVRKPPVALGAVSDVHIQSINTTSIVLQWSLPSWKPTMYEVNATRIQPSGNRHTKRAATDTGNIKIDENSATIMGLQPDAEYNIYITPIMKNPSDPVPIKGETTTVSVSMIDPTIRPAEAHAISAPISEEEDIERVEDEPQKLGTFRIISCVTLIILVCIAIFIFFFCRMYNYRDCLSQICFEISLIVAHILILVDVTVHNEVDCTTMAVSIHYFFTTCFLFFMLECFCHVKSMTNFIPLKVLNKSWQYFLIGWGVPLVIIIISAATISDHYIDKDRKYHCWLNLDEEALYATVIPIGIFAAAAVLFLLLAVCARPKDNYEVDEESYIRYEPMQDIRWMLIFISTLLVSHWALGMIAVHQADDSLYIAFVVLNIILGIAILLLRCIGDEEVRLRMRRCAQGSSIGPEEEGDIGKYLSSHNPVGIRKGFLHGGQGTDGCLIMKKSYIFRP